VDKLEAVQTAKHYITDLYSGEGITKPRLEELNYDRLNRCWLITIGFAYREGDEGATELTPNLARAVYGDRVYKLVRVNDGSGQVIGMTDRMLDPSLPS
jgi:hypothetical protein